MENQERINQIREAIELIEQAMELVDDAVAGSRKESHFRAYGKYGFNQLLNNGNPYDSGLQDLINEFEKEL